MIVTASLAGAITPAQTILDNQATANEGKELSAFFDLLAAFYAVAQSPALTEELGHADVSKSAQTDDPASTQISADGSDPSAHTPVLLHSLLTLVSPAAQQLLAAPASEQNIVAAGSSDRYSPPVTAILTDTAVGEIGAGGDENAAAPSPGTRGFPRVENSPELSAQVSNQTDKLATIIHGTMAIDNTPAVEGNGIDPSSEALVNAVERKSPIHAGREVVVDKVSATGVMLPHGDVEHGDPPRPTKAGESQQTAEPVNVPPFSAPILASVPGRSAASPRDNFSVAGDGQSATLQSLTAQTESWRWVTSNSPPDLATERAGVESAGNVKDGFVLTTSAMDSRRDGAAAMQSRELEQPFTVEIAIDDGVGKSPGATGERKGESRQDLNLRTQNAAPASSDESATIEPKPNALHVAAESHSPSAGHRAEQFADPSSVKFSDNGGDPQQPTIPRLAPDYPEVAAALSHRLETAANEFPSATTWRPVVHHVAHEILGYVRIGKQEAVIQLDPPELGKIKIELRVDADRVEARIIAEEHSARSLIENHLPELRQALEVGRINVAELRVDQQSGASAQDQWTPGYHEAPQHAGEHENRDFGAASESLNDHAQVEKSALTEIGHGRISMWA